MPRTVELVAKTGRTAVDGQYDFTEEGTRAGKTVTLYCKRVSVKVPSLKEFQAAVAKGKDEAKRAHALFVTQRKTQALNNGRVSMLPLEVRKTVSRDLAIMIGDDQDMLDLYNKRAADTGSPALEFGEDGSLQWVASAS